MYDVKILKIKCKFHHQRSNKDRRQIGNWVKRYDIHPLEIVEMPHMTRAHILLLELSNTVF